MAKKQVQAYLSQASERRVDEIREKYSDLDLSESGAVNLLIEKLIRLEKKVSKNEIIKQKNQ